MDFTLLEEHRMLQDTVRRFIRQELLPLESLVLQRDTQGLTGEELLPNDVEERLLAKARDAGLWGLDVPEEFGGLNLGALPKCLATEELYKTITPFTFHRTHPICTCFCKPVPLSSANATFCPMPAERSVQLSLSRSLVPAPIRR